MKDTLNLPKTDFPIRSNHQIEDEKIIARWKESDLYKKSFEKNSGKEKYILHDGPPYANGDIHLGHAYNKILKDIVAKVHRMMGKHVPVVPGWDCHGLPIEKKAIQDHADLSKTGYKSADLIKACRETANKWIKVQKESFRNLGILMDFENPYITMESKYEADTVRAFSKFFEGGFIERKNKTVTWCFHDQTVLASAEIEYKDRKDPSVYVLFELNSNDASRLFKLDQKLSLLVWTTTPWTLPLNQAVYLKPATEYVIVDFNGTLCIVAESVVGYLNNLFKLEGKIVSKFVSEYLSGTLVKHPFIDKEVPIIFDDSVELKEGTACVHCAPGCGQIDYEIGVKNNLQIYSPVSSDGKYTDEVMPKELTGMSVVDGQIWVIKKLAENNKLFFKNNINHSYPHCWRCGNGLIFRATPQWFCNLEHKDIKENSLLAIENMLFVPKQGKKFLKATVSSRWEWCLSRQRLWGTPIPALLCNNCDEAFIDKNFIDKVADGIEKEGIEYWHNVDVKDLITDSVKCSCGSQDFKKEFDILDVWFDSGISHYAVLKQNKHLQFPADLYLEGLDQYRGWFQSSLITSLVIENESCTKKIMTHGYTVDAKGQKMSKSLGNVVAPSDIIKKIGTDGLRLWVSSIGNESDPVVSDIVFNNVSEVYRRIRNTYRFLLSNLYDFDITKDAIKKEDMLLLDSYAITKIYNFNKETLNSYLNYDLALVFQKIAQYFSVELSAFYLDIIKDRLYVERADSIERRSAQTALWYILDTLNKLLAPIVSFTSEIVNDHYNKNSESVHLESFNNEEDFKNILVNFLEPKYWDALKQIRSVVLKELELKREAGIIKHSLEAKIKLYIDTNREEFESIKDMPEIDLLSFYKEFFIVSQVELVNQVDDSFSTVLNGVAVLALKADGKKCPRCWQWTVTSNVQDLCLRCEKIV